MWYGPSGSRPVRGVIVIKDTWAAGVTKLTADLQGLDQQAGGYHVHTLPLEGSDPGDNVCATTSGHYNPYGECRTAPPGGCHTIIPGECHTAPTIPLL